MIMPMFDHLNRIVTVFGLDKIQHYTSKIGYAFDFPFYQLNRCFRCRKIIDCFDSVADVILNLINYRSVVLNVLREFFSIHSCRFLASLNQKLDKIA